mmetsp:Transcript_8249/g.20775  ORF Transcript_8249/g.20775 Transcript_8249/m.20775 type:complete len:428 (+) Transcript_8249:1730-3013(+)
MLQQRQHGGQQVAVADRLGVRERPAGVAHRLERLHLGARRRRLEHLGDLHHDGVSATRGARRPLCTLLAHRCGCGGGLLLACAERCRASRAGHRICVVGLDALLRRVENAQHLGKVGSSLRFAGPAAAHQPVEHGGRVRRHHRTQALAHRQRDGAGHGVVVGGLAREALPQQQTERVDVGGPVSRRHQLARHAEHLGRGGAHRQQATLAHHLLLDGLQAGVGDARPHLVIHDHVATVQTAMEDALLVQVAHALGHLARDAQHELEVEVEAAVAQQSVERCAVHVVAHRAHGAHQRHADQRHHVRVRERRQLRRLGPHRRAELLILPLALELLHDHLALPVQTAVGGAERPAAQQVLHVQLRVAELPGRRRSASGHRRQRRQLLRRQSVHTASAGVHRIGDQQVQHALHLRGGACRLPGVRLHHHRLR